jgi:hypothetical protein
MGVPAISGDQVLINGHWKVRLGNTCSARALLGNLGTLQSFHFSNKPTDQASMQVLLYSLIAHFSFSLQIVFSEPLQAAPRLGIG